MRLLELFSGTGSVSKAVGHLYDEIVSIDILEKFEPTEVADILKWDYKKYPSEYFDTIWASPPCTEYSKLKYISGAVRNLELADSIVKRTLEIIEYFNPDKWFIENPQTGLLKDREFMLGLPFVDVDYCMYCDWGYKKKTRIWTNVDYAGKLCDKKCGNIHNGIHSAPICPFKVYNVDKSVTDYRNQNKDFLYRIPEKLIKDLFVAPF
jgi:site-specific DNA-cytosine methylase